MRLKCKPKSKFNLTIWITTVALLTTSNFISATDHFLSNDRENNIENTLHNLSTVGATSGPESQICVFCHTPHGANRDTQAQAIEAPLWNRKLSSGIFSTYDSLSTQAKVGEPTGSSKLCLSCHDGSLATNNLSVVAGKIDQRIGVEDIRMPDGLGADTGFTRNLSQDLTNDHPISFSFLESKEDGKRLKELDPEIRDPQDTDVDYLIDEENLFFPTKDKAKLVPLDKDEMVQCSTCHDPHVSGNDNPNVTGDTTNNIKFLRTRRFQMQDPMDDSRPSFNKDVDIVCLACHDKQGNEWAQSVHANSTVADELYSLTASAQRDFPENIKVWQASCLNCHDTHTVAGADRLLREGTDSPLTPKSAGLPALEETCFQCHTAGGGILTAAIADIDSEFSIGYRMPLDKYNGDDERHNIQNADFIEGAELVNGVAPAAGTEDQFNAALANRHAECTDCHNPHRMVRKQLAVGEASAKGTHLHPTDTTTHTNKISGVLYGTWGVEPVYNQDEDIGRLFGTKSGNPTTFIIKSGVGTDKVEYEYQICMKCHSNYAYDDDGTPESPTRPALAAPGTPPAAGYEEMNSFKYYTNQAMEFQAPGTHSGTNHSGTSGKGNEAGATINSNNARSWHPVMAPTGRARPTSIFLAPWENTGTQTMYCTDCHGASTGNATDVVPPDGKPWGPHGSTRPFILKGEWNRGTSQNNDNGNLLCFKCHDRSAYNDTSGGSSWFWNEDKGAGHTEIHRNDKVRMDLDCTWCHVAVVHGWKNRSFLVNLKDIGPEAICRDAIDNDIYKIVPQCDPGQPILAGSEIPTSSITTNRGYSNPPYYINARLKMNGMPAYGSSWSESNCNGTGEMANLCDEGTGF